VVTRLLHHQEVERKSIAVEIHDEIAQALSAIKLRMESLLGSNHPVPPALSGAMTTITGQIKEEIQRIRQVTKRLSPIMIDDLGIATAIISLCRETADACRGRSIEPHIDVDEGRLTDELKIVIYRVLEELLSLASRHCEADRCRISLHQGSGRITLAVQVWGRPMDRLAGDNDWELSMAVIRNRAESFGGALTLESTDQQANTITVWWPLDPKPSNLLASSQTGTI
jgi:signal transduction histidine kinase